MPRLIDADAYAEELWKFRRNYQLMDDTQTADKIMHGLYRAEQALKDASTIEAVPIKFIDEVIEYLTKCRDYAIHEETKTAWDEQRQTLIMLLHEWAAWNECGRTGKYGERSET